MECDLDSPKTYLARDPTALGQRLSELPSQCQAAWAQSRNFPWQGGWNTIDKVIIGGMGGSAIAGDLVTDLAGALGRAGVPITVVRDFQVPFAPDRRSLVILSSHSGNTEETLSLYQQVRKTEARTLVITGGGRLAAAAAAHQIPVFRSISSGEPRHAVGYNLMLILGALARLGLVPVSEGDVQDAVGVLQQQVARMVPQVPTGGNRAKQQARELAGKLIVVYGGGLFAGLARRWKTQFNENAKAWAFFEVIPELCHNSVEAYNSRPGRFMDIVALLLQPSNLPESIGERYSTLSKLLHQSGIPNRLLSPADGPPLDQLLGMLLMGDYASYYLALLGGVDPSPTPMINLVKQRQVFPHLTASG